VDFTMLGNELLQNPHLARAVRAALQYASADPFSRDDRHLREFEEALGQFKGVLDSYIRRARLSPEWACAMDHAHRVLSELSSRHSGRLQAESFLGNLQRMAGDLQETLQEELGADAEQVGEMLEQLQRQGLPGGAGAAVGGAVETIVNLIWSFLYALAVIAPLETILGGADTEEK